VTCNFDSYAESYDADLKRAVAFARQDPVVFTQAKARVLLKIAETELGDLSAAAALDVGCGVGSIHRFVRPSFRELQAVDVSVGVLEHAKLANPDVEYSSYDGAVLPFAPGSVDLAFAICVLHHVLPQQWATFVSEMTRVVRPGGLVVIIEHNPVNPLTRLVTLRCAFDEGIVLVKRRRLENLMSRAGLKNPTTKYVVFSPWRRAMIERIEDRLGRLPLGAQYVTYAARPR
jgi:SAM-dependent methyltransferase